MRVLSVTKSTGGVANYNRTLCERLAARGHQMHAVCLSEGNESYAAELGELGLETTCMAMERYAIAPLSDLRLAVALRRLVGRRPADVMVAHGAKAGLVVRLVGRMCGVPTIYVLHSMPFLERVQGRRAVLYRQLERLGARLGGHIVAITHAGREELKRNRIAAASNVTVIHTGIELEPYSRPTDRAAARRDLGLDTARPVVGWAGRLSAQKAPADYLRAATRIAAAVPEAQIFMAGEGPLEGRTRALARELGLSERLVATGWQRDVPAMLAAFDVYVSSSLWEGLPLAILEAMAARRPVVATAVDGVVEAIDDGVEGRLVPAADPEALGDGVVELLADAALRERLGEAARRRVEASFTVDRMVDQWEALLGERAGRSRQKDAKA